MKEQLEINNLDYSEYIQPNVVHLFALVGMSITGVMAIIGLFKGTILLSSILFIVSFVYFISCYICTKLNKLVLSSAIVLYSLYCLMFYLIYSGGVDNTGPLWIFIVAPVSLFIHGLKRGLIDIAVFVIVISTIMFIPTNVMTHAIYSPEYKLRLIYSFLTVTFLSGLYEYSRDQFYKHTVELSKKYQQLAHIDSLTQLSNRRDALIILNYEKSKIVRNNEPFSIILCDIDFFKKINDQYGHNAGDMVLIELAKLFSQNIREQDSISRWGGEEFLFILPQTSALNAVTIAQKIQEKIREHIIYYDKREIMITVSMGIEEFSQNKSIDEVVNSADKYLYQAKNSGRNKICSKYN